MELSFKNGFHRMLILAWLLTDRVLLAFKTEAENRLSHFLENIRKETSTVTKKRPVRGYYVHLFSENAYK